MRTSVPMVVRTLAVLMAVMCTGAGAACPPAGHTVDSLQKLRATEWAVADAPRQDLAVALLDCLDDPDPALRDGVAFEALAHWMRAGALDTATLHVLRTTLSERLAAADDDAGFRRPFAALVLAEVARVDRIEPWLEESQRAALVDLAATYLSGVRDYRGFDAREGWRHGVAHGADFALQLVLNPALDKDAVRRLLEAVGSQVVAADAHAYVHGEPARLSMPVLFAVRRGMFDAGEWTAWIESVASPGPHADWAQTFRSEAGLARRHNVRAFLLSLYVNLAEGSDEASRALLLPPVVAALRAMG